MLNYICKHKAVMQQNKTTLVVYHILPEDINDYQDLLKYVMLHTKLIINLTLTNILM